jgi:hypothetical protein
VHGAEQLAQGLDSGGDALHCSLDLDLAGQAVG